MRVWPPPGAHVQLRGRRAPAAPPAPGVLRESDFRRPRPRRRGGRLRAHMRDARAAAGRTGCRSGGRSDRTSDRKAGSRPRQTDGLGREKDQTDQKGGRSDRTRRTRRDGRSEDGRSIGPDQTGSADRRPVGRATGRAAGYQGGRPSARTAGKSDGQAGGKSDGGGASVGHLHFAAGRPDALPPFAPHSHLLRKGHDPPAPPTPKADGPMRDYRAKGRPAHGRECTGPRETQKRPHGPMSTQERHNRGRRAHATNAERARDWAPGRMGPELTAGFDHQDWPSTHRHPNTSSAEAHRLGFSQTDVTESTSSCSKRCPERRSWGDIVVGGTSGRARDDPHGRHAQGPAGAKS